MTVNTENKAGQIRNEVLPAEFYNHFLSERAKQRKPSPIRSLYPLEQTPGIISFLAGKPNGSSFPLTELQFKTRSPINSEDEISLKIVGAELEESLQYGPTAGLPSLNNWVVGLQEREHDRDRSEGWRLSITSGSQDGIYKAVDCLTNPGDTILVERPVYAGVIPMFMHCDIVEVETDAQGIQSQSLRSILENWPMGKPKPKFLYTVPYGCNPTGMTATLDRRLEVLELARQHNFLILEDDAYYYVYYGTAPRIPSYFRLEAQMGDVGRVLRFDSFSKFFSAGMRLGVVTGPVPIVNAIDMLTANANLQASSLSQAIAFSVLDAWGYDGFKTHTENVSQLYRQKRDVFEAALREHLTGLVEWNTPEAGMFFWFKLLLSEDAGGEGDSEEIIRSKAFQGGVLALPGTVFHPNGAKTAYVRAAFSLLPEDDVNEALRRLRTVLLETRRQTV